MTQRLYPRDSHAGTAFILRPKKKCILIYLIEAFPIFVATFSRAFAPSCLARVFVSTRKKEMDSRTQRVTMSVIYPSERSFVELGKNEERSE